MSDKNSLDEKRKINAYIFKETKLEYNNNTKLRKSIENSILNQKVYFQDDNIEIKSSRHLLGKIIISENRTLQAAEKYSRNNKKICALNFASAVTPGGGVVHGSPAQEESICRCTTLYPCLNITQIWNDFYTPHRNLDTPLYNDDCIYTPNVKVFKSDTKFPQMLKESDWWNIDILSCAAPNLKKKASDSINSNSGGRIEISNIELENVLESRIERIFKIAIINDVDIFVLGAFGCGAYKNPPKIVANIFGEYTRKYRTNFDVIEYAIYHPKNKNVNYNVFKSSLKGLF